MAHVINEVTNDLPNDLPNDLHNPKRVFIVPYRNRLQQKFFFCNQMNFILEGQTDYEILFVHQTDSRSFNRGAMKNIVWIKIWRYLFWRYLFWRYLFHIINIILNYNKYYFKYSPVYIIFYKNPYSRVSYFIFTY